MVFSIAEGTAPDAVLTSPYLRARQTAELLLQKGSLVGRVRTAALG